VQTCPKLWKSQSRGRSVSEWMTWANGEPTGGAYGCVVCAIHQAGCFERHRMWCWCVGNLGRHLGTPARARGNGLVGTPHFAAAGSSSSLAPRETRESCDKVRQPGRGRRSKRRYENMHSTGQNGMRNMPKQPKQPNDAQYDARSNQKLSRRTKTKRKKPQTTHRSTRSTQRTKPQNSCKTAEQLQNS
jgi:hypothetical protein